ncbi:type VI secretion protein [Shewanella sp. NIFS-20-20]|uniref:type VI secretion protein n=1 Tax=Shewanella sp. NIFS-20-20 TaxID=2853806 RepID=UPI001C491F92|nr:type VI secretion protein [Shewanella sp. NIFS-20-20]MBV7316845.1 type VI secretion protein [Shewanella sp. NIFS-20-20]
MKPLIMAAISTLMLTTPAYANIHQQLSQCAAIHDKLERLICFDELAANVDPAIALAPATPAVTASAAPAAPAATAASRTEEFGKPAKVAADGIDKLYFTVAKVSEAPRGEVIVTFDNGQVWRQVDSRRYKITVDEQVFIERGALGSFLLGKDSRNGTIRVTRID